MTIDSLIAMVLGNVPILGLALAASLPLIVRRRREVRQRLNLLLVFGLGIPLLWAAYFHLAKPDTAARLIGWAPSPFQREVGLADLAMGLVACLAVARPLPFKGAIIWTLAIALCGDAFGHLQEIVFTHDFAPGNAGSILWWDALAPLYALALLVAAGAATRVGAAASRG